MTFRDAVIQKEIHIQASSIVVWKYLIQPEWMKKWMLDDDTALDIETTWEAGSSIQIKGNLHGIAFENNGQIKTYDPEKALAYTHLSSLSQLPDREENYCVLEFALSETGHQTYLQLTISNFPTESVYYHLDFYWQSTLVVLKNQIEAEVNQMQSAK